MDPRKKNKQSVVMKAYLHIVALALIVVACKPTHSPTQTTTLQADSVFTEAEIRAYGEYYQSGHQVYAIDLLSDGLDYDSTFIVGSGYNLYLSDIFVPKDSTERLPAGVYTMDSLVKENTFLRGMDFEGNITGTYLLYIKNNQIEGITLFTSGNMSIDYIDGDTLLDFNLYTADSTHYHAMFHGYTNQ